MKIWVEKRESSSWWKQVFIRVFSVVFALLMMGVILLIFKENPLTAYRELFIWPFHPEMGLTDTFQEMIPILIIALGLAVTFKMKLWNIGAEGQFFMGAMFSTYGALYIVSSSMPSYIAIPFLLLLGISGGMVWALIPALLKTYAKIDEILVTLMLNYIAIFWVDFLIYGAWKDPKGRNFPLTAVFSKNTWLPMIGDTEIQTGLFFALALVVVVEVFLNRSKWGFELELLGDNPTAAQYAGVNVQRNTILAFLFSGGLAGFAGSVQALGLQHRLQHGFSSGYGFTGIIIAWLSKLNPWAMIFVSFFFGGLIVGSEQLQIVMRLPISMVSILQGLVLVSLMVGEVIFNYRIKIQKT